MNNNELDQILKSSRPPEKPAEYWEEFPAAVLRHLANESVRRPVLSPNRARLVWSFVLSLACVVILLVIGYARSAAPADQFALLQDRKALAQIFSLFPHRLQAIQQDASGIHLVLSESEDIPAAQPIWIKICNGKDCRAFVTFSGQQIQFAGQKVEVLQDDQGQVLLVGDRFAWSSGQPKSFDSTQHIEAHLFNYLL
jgi:hypothetical protein